MIQRAVSYNFVYNGLGDRLQQTVGTVTTNYTLDLNTGLTQVLTDGTDTYLYGLGRIGEYDSANWTYPLADALGSVRQLVDASGAPVMAQNYAPYGDVLESYGAESSNYGFAGEWTDGTGLQYLRARYLNTGIGRFISRDTWGGDYNRPMSLNRWMYVEGNPVMRVDPSGMYHTEVHRWLTLRFVREIDPGLANFLSPNDINNTLAAIIANANQGVDTTDTLKPKPGHCVLCHFQSLPSTLAHVDEAIETRNPYLFGATLHQLQDYYTHWREGYRTDRGHAIHTVKYWLRDDWDYEDFFEGGHYNYNEFVDDPIWIEATYGHQREDVIQDIKNRNPGFDPSNLSDDEIMNLYLRRDPTYANPNERFEERDQYGIDPDMYLPGTHRDNLMEASVRKYMKRFFDAIAGDPCNIDWTIPETPVIRELLLR